MGRRSLRSRLSKIGFQKGSVPHNKGMRHDETPNQAKEEFRYKRLPLDQYRMVVRDQSELVREQESNANPPMLLRPIRPRETELDRVQRAPAVDGETDTYRLISPRKTAQMFNEAHREHMLTYKDCAGSLDWDSESEIQRGLAWRVQVKCNTCKYISQRYNLYNEVPLTRRGPKVASCNYGVQVGLAHTSVSNTGLSKILLSANTPAPSLSSMQAAANRVGDVLIETNEKSMSDIRADLREINQLRGLAETTPINIEMDCRYNNPIYSGIGKTPFQAGTQATHLVVENSSSRKHVISVNNKNKLCQKCGLTHREDNHVCSANIPAEKSIGDERQWARESLVKLREDGVTPHMVTTDADSSAFRAVEDVYLSSESTIHPPQHQIDTRHVSASQRRHVTQETFSKKMFPGTTAEMRSKSQRRFASDLATRCQAEHAQAMCSNGGDTGKTLRKLYLTKSAIAKCYTGDHSLCRRHSFVCRGRISMNWMHQSSYLQNDFKIQPTTNDHVLLMSHIEYRLGSHVLPRVRHLLTTQKTEAVNKAISNTVPRNSTFTKNYSGRVHAAVMAVNTGVGESILKACAAADVPLTPGSRVTRGLLRLQNLNKTRKDYKASKKAKHARKMKRSSLFQLYDKCKSEKKTVTYQKELCMPVHDEHSYVKRSTQKNTN